MSLTTDITNLTAQVSQLIQTVDQQDDVVRQKINELAAMVPNMVRTIYVDAANGDDGNDGLAPTTAVATLTEALQRGVRGGYTLIRLLSDIGHGVWAYAQEGYVHVEGWDAATEMRVQRTITYGSVASNRTEYVAGIEGPAGGLLWWSSIRHHLPTRDASVVDGGRSVHMMWRGGAVVYHECDITSEVNADTCLIRTSHAVTSVGIYGTTIAADLAAGTGRLFYGVAANADPNGIWNIITNITAN